MKHLLHLLIALFITPFLYAQAPQKMTYQAIIRDASSSLIQNKSVGIRISILQGTSTGTAVYAETHTASTNTNGLVTIEVGGGSAQSSSFSAIDWSKGPYYIKTEVDPTGGSSYTISGSSQLLSVPYALYAATSGSSSSSSSTNVIDNLTTTSTSDALSANQGKVLKGLIDALSTSSGNTSSSSTLTGDVTSTGNVTKIEKIQGNILMATTPLAGQALRFNGIYWGPVTESLLGDVTGTYASNKVVQIQNIPIAPTAPASGQILKYNGASWIPEYPYAYNELLMPQIPGVYASTVQDALYQLKQQIVVAAGGGITSVYHDGTLTGSGISGSVLGLADGAVTSAKLADKSVTLSKLVDIPTNTLLGRYSSGSGSPETITLGSGLTLSGGVLSSTGGSSTSTDSQTLSLSGSTLTISNGNSVTGLVRDVKASTTGGLTSTVDATSGVATIGITTNAIGASNLKGSSTALGNGTSGQVLTSDGTGGFTWGSISSSYTLPAATTTTLGGIMAGTGLSVSSAGLLSANISNSITTDASATDKYPSVSAMKTYVDSKSYVLPAATTTTLGGIMAGTGLSVSSAGLLSANISNSVTTDASSTDKYPSVLAIKTYVDSKISSITASTVPITAISGLSSSTVQGTLEDLQSEISSIVTSGGSGTVTSVSVATANGLKGSVTNPNSTPTITLSTTQTGLLKGYGSTTGAIGVASAGTDYLTPTAGNALTASNLSQSGTGILYQSAATTTTTITNPSTTGYVLTWNGTAPVWQANASSGLTSVSGDNGTATGLTLTASAVTSNTQTLTLGGKLSIANGGTGATTAAGALTALGAQPVNSNLTALSGISTSGILAQTATGAVATRKIVGSSDILVTNGDGISGDPTLSLSTTGVTAGIYTSADITIDAQGRITAAASGTSGSTATALNVTSEQTDTYTALATDDIILLNISVSGKQIVLPTTGISIGKKYYISNKGSKGVTISPTPRETSVTQVGALSSCTMMYIGGTGSGSWSCITGY